MPNNKLNEKTYTIQESNKIFKLMIIVSWIMLLLGVFHFEMESEPEVKIILIVSSVFLYIMAKTLTWWYHK